jgi:ferric-dicitrate binding protein FerR (iron transport regulator)
MDDGSLLTLDAGTTIRIQKGARHIELADGQVFFDVKKDDQHPFTIHSQDLTTTVLGTSFTISAYQGLHDLDIGVVSGRIRVASATSTLAFLGKNEEFSYNKTTKAYRTIPLDESMTAWQEGRLLLNDLSFPEMAVLLQKDFGVTIETTQDAVAHTKYTTELRRSMTADEAIQVLAAIHHLKIKKQYSKILLYK